MNKEIDISNVTLKTERLTLRPWVESDLEDFFEYARVPDVGNMAGWPPHENIEGTRMILGHFIEGKHTFAIEYKGKVIGSLGIEMYNEEDFKEFEDDKCREIGYVLSKDYWGRGLMPEAVNEAIRYLFEDEKLDVIMCGHFKRNGQSKRVQEKCGFRYYCDYKYKTIMGTVEDTTINVMRKEDYFRENHCIVKLSRRYPQILMPCEKDISKSEEYRNVCLRGEKCDREITFSLDNRDRFETYHSEVGDVEILSLYRREDFIHMARCLAHRCEPVDIPDSTGAVAIFGLNNWDKVRAGMDNYKDSFILLSSGNYSDVSNSDVYKVTNGELNLSEEEWIEKSIAIRKYHEITHFVMRKKFPDDIKPLRDELIADMVGLMGAFRTYDVRLARLFLGIESVEYRKGGRLENYKGGNEENIPSVNKAIDELKELSVPFEGKDADVLFHDISRFIEIKSVIQ